MVLAVCCAAFSTPLYVLGVPRVISWGASLALPLALVIMGFMWSLRFARFSSMYCHSVVLVDVLRHACVEVPRLVEEPLPFFVEVPSKGLKHSTLADL